VSGSHRSLNAGGENFYALMKSGSSITDKTDVFVKSQPDVDHNSSMLHLIKGGIAANVSKFQNYESQGKWTYFKSFLLVTA
jgi:hypothetical protein